MQPLGLAITAALLAIAITTTMDATGYTLFSALPLIPLLLIFAIIGRTDRRALGFRAAPWSAYVVALLAPLALLIPLTLAAALLGASSLGETNWGESLKVIAIMFLAGIIMVAITEEGFFRGLLWTLLQRAGQREEQVLLTTTACFVLWHLSPVLLTEQYAPPLAQVPIYLVNATLLGLIWGRMRQVSGSIWPPAIYHSLWNALVYQLYGYGTKTGDLGVEATAIYGPEIGLAGIALNAIMLAYLLRSPVRPRS